LSFQVLLLYFFAAIGFLTFMMFVAGLVYTSFRLEYNPVDEVREALEEVENEPDDDNE